MDEIVKHINDTNASYRSLNSGDAKNTDLFLDNDHYELFRNNGDKITVRFRKDNLCQAILFIASILPRKYDQSTIHKKVYFSTSFVYNQLALLNAFFTKDGTEVDTRCQTWNPRKDILKKNGDIDNRFYFNGLLEDVLYKDINGHIIKDKFTIRNYLAGGYSDLHIKRGEDNIFDVWITNVLDPYNDGKENGREIIDSESHHSLQEIYYGAPGTGKSNTIKRDTLSAEEDERVFRTTFIQIAITQLLWVAISQL